MIWIGDRSESSVIIWQYGNALKWNTSHTQNHPVPSVESQTLSLPFQENVLFSIKILFCAEITNYQQKLWENVIGDTFMSHYVI